GPVRVAVCNNLLYAFGGGDRNTFESTERFDPATEAWSSDVAPMSHARIGHGLATLDGFIYAVGGLSDAGALNIVERYDPRRNQWTSVASMGENDTDILSLCSTAVYTPL
ncbi:kelch repeat protein, partial [Ostertagia ostertagi]